MVSCSVIWLLLVSCQGPAEFDLLIQNGTIYTVGPKGPPIEVGKLGDFTVFSRDIMQIPEYDILETKVVYTIVGGNVYHVPKSGI